MVDNLICKVRRRQFRTDNSGTSAVEFALLSPLFMLLLLGMVGY
ncbi:MAG: pilus assembly protein, partial [Mesorhizobium sp.]